MSPGQQEQTAHWLANRPITLLENRNVTDWHSALLSAGSPCPAALHAGDSLTEQAVCAHVQHRIDRQQSTIFSAVKLSRPFAEPCTSCPTQEQKQLLADALEAADFQAGTFIFRRGDVGDRFYIVREGSVVLSKPRESEPAAPLTEGACFGERALMRDNTRRVQLPPTVHCITWSCQASVSAKSHPQVQPRQASAT